MSATRIINKSKGYSIRFLNWKLGNDLLRKTNNLQLGSASISVVRCAISRGGMKCYRIEIMQDFISKNYSCARRNMERELFNNKKLMDDVSKTSKARFFNDRFHRNGRKYKCCFFQLIPM